MKNFLYRVFCGFFLGISIFAPGVSGSVMAVMMGIYNRLLDIVSAPLKNLKKNIIYLFPMGIGAVLSLVMFVVVFSWLFEEYEKATFLLFMGLIAGNLPVVFRDANQDGFKPHYMIGIALAFGIAVTVGVLRMGASESAWTASLIYCGVCGAIAGVASMVPGMSISMVLMVLGVYSRFMEAAKSLDIVLVGVVGICFLAGMVSFSRLTKYLLHRFHGFTYFMVFGFMCGSLVSIFIGLPAEAPGFNWGIGALMIAIGLGISLLFVRLSKSLGSGEDAHAEQPAKA